MTDAPQRPHPTDVPAPAAAPLDVPAPVTRTSLATDVALVSTFAAFIAVCAILPAIPTPSGVPITLQTFGVILAGLVLGWRRGALAVALYLAVGLAGVPVFSGGAGGLAVLAGPTVGYLLAFPFGAALAGAFAGRALRVPVAWRYAALVGSGLAASFLTIHPAGIAGLMARLGLPFGEALAIDVVYWPGDVVKNLLAAAVALAVFRAFPDLLRTRR
ncbi:biotin transporter BioY [Cellulomonas biazotea]|uniref:Biotin transporter n=1 Tax=Cellulomonas biazotea TaxID=1709 RepID=A0A402DM54_9CELL|nr:biotin transporter BioY [Cellulomonas biazotea]GCE75219.1 hypothetical protein CBZ_02750 [Cellulomonas biazotea]